ncbi:MAG: hypothetical protein AB1428_12210 [Bacteroidota bacterium]
MNVHLLHNHWIHSHEEDTATERIYRPAGFPFPRSRGRASFELRPDGTLIDHPIGPADGAGSVEGRWRIQEDGTLEMFDATGTEAKRVLRIAFVEEDRLGIETN